MRHLKQTRSSRSPGSAFFGSPIRQSLPRQHLNLGSPSIGNILKIATSSSFSFARLILSSPTVFVCRCSLLDSRSLNASVAIFPLAIKSFSLSKCLCKQIRLHSPAIAKFTRNVNFLKQNFLYSLLCVERDWA